MAHLSLDAKGGQWLADLGPKRRAGQPSPAGAAPPKAANRPQTGFDAPAAGDFGIIL